MYFLSSNFRREIGPVTDVWFFPDTARIHGANTGRRKFRALFDTGATRTLISQEVINASRPQIHYKSGSIVTNTTTTRISRNYSFGIGLEMETENGDPMVWVLGIGGTEFFKRNRHFDILLGLDVICRGDFHISSDLTFSYSLRT